MDPRRLTAFQGEVNVYIREPRGVTAVIGMELSSRHLDGHDRCCACDGQHCRRKAGRTDADHRIPHGSHTSGGRGAKRHAELPPRLGQPSRKRACRTPGRTLDRIHRLSRGWSRDPRAGQSNCARTAPRKARHRGDGRKERHHRRCRRRFGRSGRRSGHLGVWVRGKSVPHARGLSSSNRFTTPLSAASSKPRRAFRSAGPRIPRHALGP